MENNNYKEKVLNQIFSLTDFYSIENFQSFEMTSFNHYQYNEKINNIEYIRVIFDFNPCEKEIIMKKSKVKQLFSLLKIIYKNKFMSILMYNSNSFDTFEILNKINRIKKMKTYIRSKFNIQEFPLKNFYLQEINVVDNDYNKIFYLVEKNNISNNINEEKYQNLINDAGKTKAVLSVINLNKNKNDNYNNKNTFFQSNNNMNNINNNYNQINNNCNNNISNFNINNNYNQNNNNNFNNLNNNNFGNGNNNSYNNQNIKMNNPNQNNNFYNNNNNNFINNNFQNNQNILNQNMNNNSVNSMNSMINYNFNQNNNQNNNNSYQNNMNCNSNNNSNNQIVNYNMNQSNTNYSNNLNLIPNQSLNNNGNNYFQNQMYNNMQNFNLLTNNGTNGNNISQSFSMNNNSMNNKNNMQINNNDNYNNMFNKNMLGNNINANQSLNNPTFHTSFSGYNQNINNQNIQNIQNKNLQDFRLIIEGKSNSTNEFPFVGLRNVGLTCYMNSTLQCLLHIPELNDFFLNIYSIQKNDFKKINSSTETKGALSQKYFELILTVFQNSTNKYEPYPKKISPDDFHRAIGTLNPQFRAIDANDSKDLLIFLFQSMHEELNYFGDKKLPSVPKCDQRIAQNAFEFFMKVNSELHLSIFSYLFYGIFKSETKCLTCKSSYYNFQYFQILSFPLYDYDVSKKKSFNIYQGFKDYIKKVIMKGDNQCFCQNCQQLRDSEVSSKIFYTPPYLIIKLDYGKNKKYNPAKINFGEYLDLTGFIEDSCNKKNYELIGISSHIGRSGVSGHYIAYCKNQSKDDQNWYEFNDSSISPAKFKDINEYSPYVLIYKRVDNFSMK